MPATPPPVSLRRIQERVVACRACPRLVEWRETVAEEKRAAFARQDYWGKPVPGFGDPAARLLVVGLAPAAHGANRTGRMFTGDRSGDWLYRALYRAGFASRPLSARRGDGLELRDCFVTAAVRCAPPGNKPTPAESEACRSFLEEELGVLREVRVLVALGKFAYDQLWRILQARGEDLPVPRTPFGHGMEVSVGPNLTLIASFHPSQQNTFTGKLTEDMFQEVWARVGELLG